MKNLVRKSGRFLFGKVMPAAAYPVLSGPLKGARFILGSLAGEGGGASVYFNKVEIEQTAAMVEITKAGDVVYDIGANAGYYSILASRLVGKAGVVVALEPLIRNVAFLHKHTEINNAANVRVMAFACSATNSIMSFAMGDNNAMGHLENSLESRGEVSHLVPTITLDDLVERTGLMPNIIKIDVEGAEMDVLLGGQRMLKAAKPFIFLSTHSDQLRIDCVKWLEDIGYKSEPLIEGDGYEFLMRHSDS